MYRDFLAAMRSQFNFKMISCNTLELVFEISQCISYCESIRYFERFLSSTQMLIGILQMKEMEDLLKPCDVRWLLIFSIFLWVWQYLHIIWKIPGCLHLPFTCFYLECRTKGRDTTSFSISTHCPTEYWLSYYSKIEYHFNNGYLYKPLWSFLSVV